MQLPALLTSDLHFTANPADEYRWSLFKWLATQVAKEGVRSLVILGDLTDAKDYHPAELTNSIVQGITMLSWLGCKITILQGNHDYLKKGHSYFSFLSHLPNVTFVDSPREDDDGGPLAYYLPHTHEPAKDWDDLDFSHYDYLFMHQTISGSVASNGQEMDGEPGLPDFTKLGPKVYSGDIHVPQVIKGVEYVGSPYHVHFGDNFKPRCILIGEDRKPANLYFKTISRRSLKATSLADVKAFDLGKGDQVKLTITLDPADAHAWARIRREATAILTDRGVAIHDLRLAIARSERRLQSGQGGRLGRSVLSDPDAILRFVERDELGPEALELGLEALR